MKKFYLNWTVLVTSLYVLNSSASSDKVLVHKNIETLKTATPPLQEFYLKRKTSNEIIIKSSIHVDDKAFDLAFETASKILEKRVDIKNKLIAANSEIVILAKNENFCDLPEAAHLQKSKTFDNRMICDLRGGSFKKIALTVVDEANILKLDQDIYGGKQDLLTHELAHTVYHHGITPVEKQAINAEYERLKALGTLNFTNNKQPSYLMQTEEEFFAVISSIWFGAHNPKSIYHPEILNDRIGIKEYTPIMFEILKGIYRE